MSSYSQSNLLRSSSSRSLRNLTLTTAAVAVGGDDQSSGNVSPTTRRWQRTVRVIRNDICLVHQLTAGFQSRGDLFRHLFLTHGTFVIQELRHLISPPRLLPDGPDHQNNPPRYQLRFINRVKSPSFTTDLVRDEKGHPIQVEIYDSYTQLVVSPDCFPPSAKVRITVLDSDRRVLVGRNGKGPILIGHDLIVHLKNGVATFKNIVFNDNSSWANRWFWLGAIAEFEGEGYLNGGRVQQGVSEPFEVKDRKSKESQKPDKLELKHSVRSLKRIGKDRASRLENKNINKVEDFLSLYYHDQSELRKILGIKSESDKEWETIVKHAMECANEFYKALKSTSQPQQVSMLGRTIRPCLVGSSSSVPIPSENNLINPGLAPLEIPDNPIPMDDLFEIAESTYDNIWQSPSRSNSFDIGSCELLIQGFLASMSSSEYQVPLTPRRNAKIKALLRSITFFAVPRKRARIVPPVNQTIAPAV